MGIINYHIKQNIAIHIGEVFSRSWLGSLADIRVVPRVVLKFSLILKTSQENVCEESLSLVTIQASVKLQVSLEIYLQPFFGIFQNIWTYFRIFLNTRPVAAWFCKIPRLSCSICFSFLRRCAPFLHLCVK